MKTINRWLLPLILGAFVMCEQRLVAAGEADAHTIQSPHLEVMDNRRLDIHLPVYLFVTSRAAEDDWRTIESDFICSVRGEYKKPEMVMVEIIQWPVSRAQRKGAMSGEPFKTKSGLSGIRKGNEMEDDGKVHCYSSLTIANKRKDAVIFIKVSPEPELPVGGEGCRALQRISADIFEAVRFVK